MLLRITIQFLWKIGSYTMKFRIWKVQCWLTISWLFSLAFILAHLFCFLLVGNIRVYCRIRPFLPGQCQKKTTIEYIGENGELVVANPLKQGKDSHRLFKFNKVFSPAATQGFIFALIMSCLMYYFLFPTWENCSYLLFTLTF